MSEYQGKKLIIKIKFKNITIKQKGRIKVIVTQATTKRQWTLDSGKLTTKNSTVEDLQKEFSEVCGVEVGGFKFQSEDLDIRKEWIGRLSSPEKQSS